MVKCQVILDAIERIAPRHLAEEWDNPGLLVGSPAQEVGRILVALDVSDEVVHQAIEQGAKLIVAHHPLIFHPLKKLRTDLPLGHRLSVLLKHDIAVVAAHTNLDIAQGGVNDVLANAIGLSKLSSFIITEQHEDGAAESLGRIGFLPAPMTIRDFAAKVREALPTQHVRFVDAGARPVRRVALCSGAGAEFIGKAAMMGADVYVTGDVKYHDAQQAAELGMHLIDAGHFGTEFPVVSALAARLRQELQQVPGEVRVLEDQSSRDFFELA
ncbi:Nif3-like dinuclear metal center hexameric protein [Mitsuokella sp. AF21-1AC]|uniref:Nif3-like dinuclear metal center hexameric protein n=1 Tax=Mitsuokella sp. AF21-1AC TaxID=2292235 RepID=UPI000E46D8D6|nr:Nif3-like dinuclear metal center hexameric protein [Mitsuokella sp. AF21-1AC]RGS73465.1 Nif3-like dinuclear metal center hexameric protein [Mitsuokella sp. AF21-1AC]